MSQKKVDSYKEKKANRKQILKKEKAILRLEKLVAVIVGVVIVCWVGFSVYGKVVESQENVLKETLVDTTALDNYMSGLAADEELEAEVVEDEAAVEDEEVVEDEAAVEDEEVVEDEAAVTEEAEEVVEEEEVEETTEEEVVEDTEEETTEETEE